VLVPFLDPPSEYIIDPVDENRMLEMTRLVDAFVTKRIDEYPEHCGLLEEGWEFANGIVP